MGKSSSASRRGPRENRRAPETHGIGAIIRRDVLSVMTSKTVRETVESIVIAFALAFLFRTFEAEAFVIPTGSMAPTLQGRHQLVDCPMCGHRYRISASQEIDQASESYVADVAVGTCPNCRYTTCTNLNLGRNLMNQPAYNVPFNSTGVAKGEDSKSRSGDRILVNKFAYQFGEPERWDVFVFRFPGQTSRNYIKRLVGLSDETLKIERGDIHTAPYDPRAEVDPGIELDYEIERKPPRKVLAMRQLVYDNDHQAAELSEAGWPRRWSSWPREVEPGQGGWIESDDYRNFETDGSSPEDVWIRYQHFSPSFQDWERVLHPDWFPDDEQDPKPQLISDTYAYNTSVGYRFQMQGGKKRWAEGALVTADHSSPFGMHWVGDLVIEGELEVRGDKGEAVLELVEGGRHFQCRIDVATGAASLQIDGSGEGFDSEEDETSDAKPSAQTIITRPGTYEIAFANVDSQLLVWIDGALVLFDRPTTYRQLGNVTPKWDDQALRGDLAPAGIGSNQADLRVGNLRLYRDVYYIAASNQNSGPDYLAGPLGRNHTPTLQDWNMPLEQRRRQFLSTPELWPDAFRTMAFVVFPLAKFPHESQKDQFLALGDNSPQSKDSRLWSIDNTRFFVERELLVGKAMAIYWPPTHIQFVR